MTECQIEVCTGSVFARGWCSKHYTRWQRWGDPEFTKVSSPLPKNAKEKRCPRCKTVKPVTEFRRRKRGGALAGYCKPCEAETIKTHLATPAGQVARARTVARYRDEKRHPYELARRYGITSEDYADLIERQSGRCAVCGTDSPGGKIERWCVDHDHQTGKVRGLLCAHCNMGIGQLGDDPARLRAAADYLERVREN